MIETLLLSPDDWGAWRELRLAALAEAPAAFSSRLSDWTGAGDTEQRWRARLIGVALNIVVTCDGEPAGMISATAPDDDGAIHVMSVWVAPSARGRGVGDAAFSRVLAWVAAEHGGRRVVLSVKTDNDSAMPLYERHGFTDAGPSPSRPDERLMSR